MRPASARRRIALVVAALLVGALAGLWAIGGALTAPNPSVVGALPPDLSSGESVLIPSASGSTLHGWFLTGPDGAPAVVLLHSLHGSRKSMLGRARFLNRAGYAVLLFDFQANGESPGDHVTFGHLESLDARAAVDYVRARMPGARVGAVGASMGGAAAILADPPLPVDALVLEAVYPSLDRAVADRLAMRLGEWSGALGPLLTLQVRPRLGFSPDDLRPIDRVAGVAAPKLFVAGSEDRHTRIDEARALFDAASEPKELWVVEGAAHVDLHAYDRPAYERRVLAFLDAHLR
jgi:fermentation-respiration switch protein FrsA (DUF1100 family)